MRRPDLTIATEDHNVPTNPGIGPGTPIDGPGTPVSDPVSRTQLEPLRRLYARRIKELDGELRR